MENGALQRHEESKDLLDSMRRYRTATSTKQPYDRLEENVELMMQLGVPVWEHRKIKKDMDYAQALVSLFFPSNFLDSDDGQRFKDSMILKQAERAAQPLRMRRGWKSNRYQDEALFKEVDLHQKKMSRGRWSPVELPSIQWKTTRPIIAKC